MKIKRDHQAGCNCAICRWKEGGLSQEEAMEKYAEWEAEQMKAHGWIIHFLAEDPSTPTGANYHTHGLTETFDHPDLQIIVPLGQKTVHGIFLGALDQIKEGKKFTHGETAEKIIKGYPVKFMTATEGGRNLLRIILPDQEGNLEYADMTGSMKDQYKDLEE